jgi:glycosyltransferase involved in cell wall biosynthesis
MELLPMVYLLITIAFVAYHVWAFQTTKHKPRTWEAVSLPAGQKPKVSVLVPAWNAQHDIPAFVNAFQNVDYPHKELILCVGGNDDSLPTAQHFAVTDGAPVRVLEQLPGEGKQGGLRKCFAESSGDIIYLTDIDCRMDSQSFNYVLTPILAGREQVVTGSSKPTPDQQTIDAVRIDWAVVRKVEGLQPRYVDGLLGRNCAVTRAALETINGFEFDAPTGTDYRLAQELCRAGHKILLLPASEIETEYAWPLRSYIRKHGRWVRNVLLFAERPRQRTEYYDALTAVLLPLAMIAALLLSVILSFIFPTNVAWFPAFVVLLLFVHGILNRLRYASETLGMPTLAAGTIFGALINWLGQLAMGLYGFWTWVNPNLRKRW